LLLQLMQQNGRLLSAFDLLEARLHTIEEHLGIDAPLLSEGVVPGGLSVGERAPGFALTSLDSGPSTLEALRAAGKQVVLVFSDPSCGPCTALLPDLSRWQREHAATATFALISRGTEEANRAKRTEFGVVNVLIQDDREVAEAYRVAGTPSAVVVRPDGTIGSGIVAGADGIRQLVARINGRLVAGANGAAPQPAAPPPGVPVGSPAPNATLTDLEGDPFELSDYRGEPVALLFWNPACGFCQRMLDDIKAWETEPQQAAPKLVVVSAGPADTNREQGFRSVLGLDEGFTVGKSFGAAGTPSAVLIDSEGNVASAVAVGADQVMTLLQSEGPGRQADRALETSA
jgi:peroxiredoxin